METTPPGVAAPVSPAPTAPGQVAGFWVRVGSDVIDGIVLGVFGFLCAIPFRHLFERLGERGVFIGLAVSLAYSGVLQSRIGRGQTLGKRILGLRVVKLDGSLVSLDRSLVRYAIVAFPVYQTAVVYAFATLFPFLRLEWLQSLQGGLALTLLVGCFLVIPLHPLKRGLHDLLTGTIVTRGGPLDPAFVTAKTDVRRDRLILMGALALALVGTATGAAVMGRWSSGFQASATTRAADELGMANVTVVGVKNLNAAGSRPFLLVSGFLPRPSDGSAPDWNLATSRLVAALRRDVPPSDDPAVVTITLRTGFNIGISSSYETHGAIIDLKTGQPVAPGALASPF